MASTKIKDMAGGDIGNTPTLANFLVWLQSTDGTTGDYFGGLDTLYHIMNGAAINAETGTTDTLALADASLFKQYTNAAGCTVTVPPNSSVAFPVGTVIGMYSTQDAITLAQGSGVTINTFGADLVSAGAYATLFIKKVATDSWIAWGEFGGDSIASLTNETDPTLNQSMLLSTNKRYELDLLAERSFGPIAISDETTALTTGTGKRTFRLQIPSANFEVTEVQASVITAPTGATLDVDVNDDGVSIFSTVVTIDAGEKTSTTAATPAVIANPTIDADSEITIDIDQVGSSVAGAGLRVTLIGYLKD